MKQNILVIFPSRTKFPSQDVLFKCAKIDFYSVGEIHFTWEFSREIFHPQLGSKTPVFTYLCLSREFRGRSGGNPCP